MNITYKFSLFLQDQGHPLLPEVKEVHDGTQNRQSLLFFWKKNTIFRKESLPAWEAKSLNTYLEQEGHSKRNHTPSTWGETAAWNQQCSC